MFSKYFEVSLIYQPSVVIMSYGNPSTAWHQHNKKMPIDLCTPVKARYVRLRGVREA